MKNNIAKPSNHTADKVEKEEVRKVLKSWNRFISNMKAKGAEVSNSHGQTKIKM